MLIAKHGTRLQTPNSRDTGSLEAVGDLPTRGFVSRSRDWWMRGLQRQTRRPLPAETRYSYVLDKCRRASRLYPVKQKNRRPNGDSPQYVKLVCRPGISNCSTFEGQFAYPLLSCFIPSEDLRVSSQSSASNSASRTARRRRSNSAY
jgi:hypothetical protein